MSTAQAETQAQPCPPPNNSITDNASGLLPAVMEQRGEVQSYSELCKEKWIVDGYI